MVYARMNIKSLAIEEWLFAKVMEEKQHAGVDFVYNSAGMACE